jgi:signal transduction histidine kinase
MKKFGLETKVVISVILLVLFISVLERYQMSSNIASQFINSQKSRNNLLINTISPIVSINLSLGLTSANKEYLDEIVKQNSDVLILRVVDSNKNFIYDYKKVEKKVKKGKNNYFTHNITDNLTNKYLAKIELYVSQDRYKKLLQNNNKTTIEIFLITFIILIIFIIALKKEFLSLRKLSNNIIDYNPETNNFPLKKSTTQDEIGVIHNAIIGMVGKIHSYTTLLKKVQQEKEEANLILAQQSKMACLGEMLASITHQWRQPLSIISAINVKLKVASEFKTITPNNINEDTNGIDNQLEYMTQTLKDFSEFFMPDKEMVEFSVLDSIRNIINLFEYQYKIHNININIHQKNIGKTQIIMGYNNEFKQVILNLLTNARDAILEKNSPNKEIDIHIISTDDSVKISVQDYAGGVDDSIKNKLFEPYITTKARDNGTGIGLFMSKKIIVDSMGGSLSVTNENGGALFIITLPLKLEKIDEN